MTRVYHLSTRWRARQHREHTMTRYLPLLSALLLACSSAVDDVECTTTDQCGLGLACVAGDCVRVDAAGEDGGAPDVGADAGGEVGFDSGVDVSADVVDVGADTPDVSTDADAVSTDAAPDVGPDVDTGGGEDAGADVVEDVVVPGDGCLGEEDRAQIESAEAIGGRLWQCFGDERGWEACYVEYRGDLRERFGAACTDCILDYDECAANACLDECSQGSLWFAHPCERCRRLTCDDAFLACAGLDAPYP